MPHDTNTVDKAVIPYYAPETEKVMPTQNIDGIDYIGVISIPACGLELPIIREYSESALKTAPCRYFGSVYTNDLLIAGHNYRAHFGSISRLSSGDDIVFTGVEGDVFVYEVVEIEVLPANAIEEMVAGE